MLRELRSAQMQLFGSSKQMPTKGQLQAIGRPELVYVISTLGINALAFLAMPWTIVHYRIFLIGLPSLLLLYFKVGMLRSQAFSVSAHCKVLFRND